MLVLLTPMLLATAALPPVLAQGSAKPPALAQAQIKPTQITWDDLWPDGEDARLEKVYEELPRKMEKGIRRAVLRIR